MSILDFIRKQEHRPAMMNVTPERISELKLDEIFVFGCRRSGRHYEGAAFFARENFGAIEGQGEGLQGQSYAIPTVGEVCQSTARHSWSRSYRLGIYGKAIGRSVITTSCLFIQLSFVHSRRPQRYSRSAMELIPDGRYWIEDDGYDMTSETELNIYGFIDKQDNIISKFHYYTNILNWKPYTRYNKERRRNRTK